GGGGASQAAGPAGSSGWGGGGHPGDLPALDLPPPPPLPAVAPARGRTAGWLAPLVGLGLLAGIWSWRAIASGGTPPVVIEAGGPAAAPVAEATGTGRGGESGEGAAGLDPDAGGERSPGDGEGPQPDAPEAGGSAAVRASAEPASDAAAAWAAPYAGVAAGVALPGAVAGRSAAGTGAAVGDAEPAGGSAATPLVVHVAGAVVHPGVYVLSAGARVADAVTAAGGPTANAALHALNLAAPLADGMRVQVPTQKEVEAGRFVPGQDGASPPAGAAGTDGVGTAAGSGRAGAPTRRVDVNRATAAELEALPGIGPALAQRIVADREVNGPFRRPQDLSRVSGIGEKTVAQLLPYITTGP
ncbi:MAG TPA: ComEA family DNA-binding protein, partial [Thermaerobacter sp.]